MPTIRVVIVPMSYSIHIPASVSALLEGLPPRTWLVVYGALERIALQAEVWLPDDERWEQLARHEGECLCFYADGCCVRVELQPEQRLLRVREIGRVLVHLPAERWETPHDALRSHVEQ